MKNITVSLDDDLVKRAKVRAAMEDSSVSAVVGRFLRDYAAGQTEFERLRQKETELRQRVKDFNARDRLSRDALYDRRT